MDDPSERPTDEEYARYLWLVEHVKRARGDDATIYASHPFLVKDVLFSAILVAANEALLEIARTIGAPEADREEIRAGPNAAAGAWRTAGTRSWGSTWTTTCDSTSRSLRAP